MRLEWPKYICFLFQNPLDVSVIYSTITTALVYCFNLYIQSGWAFQTLTHYLTYDKIMKVSTNLVKLHFFLNYRTIRRVLLLRSNLWIDFHYSWKTNAKLRICKVYLKYGNCSSWLINVQANGWPLKCLATCKRNSIQVLLKWSFVVNTVLVQRENHEIIRQYTKFRYLYIILYY